jgi:CheY-like chemotaxis protein
MVGNRLSTLKSAHDRILQADGAPSSLFALIRTEAKAYLNERFNRVLLEGEDILITPSAYSVLALVIHEMMTNAVKHGSLCDARGALVIAVERLAKGHLSIHWRETGGTPIATPSHRGFGRTIIEQSIPFELRGKAKLRFNTHGLEAEFHIPTCYVFSMVEDRSALIEPEGELVSDKENSALAGHSGDNAPAPSNRRECVPGHVLLVEDSMVIAMDTESSLRGLGVKRIDTVASVSEALHAIESEQPEFALVDINLGGETSESIVSELKRRGVPFVMATGYGDTSSMATGFASDQMMCKPYSSDDILSALLNTR